MYSPFHAFSTWAFYHVQAFGGGTFISSIRSNLLTITCIFYIPWRFHPYVQNENVSADHDMYVSFRTYHGVSILFYVLGSNLGERDEIVG